MAAPEKYRKMFGKGESRQDNEKRYGGLLSGR